MGELDNFGSTEGTLARMLVSVNQVDVDAVRLPKYPSNIERLSFDLYLAK